MIFKNKIISIKRQNIAIAIASLSVFALSDCREESKQTLPQRNYQMVWNDEFNDAAGKSPDATKWSFDIGTGSNGWGNSELEYYTNRTDNVSTDGNGNLVITAKSESYGGSSYTSGRIKTKGLFEQAYGKMEARIKTPFGPGIWPAFWMLGNNADTVGWPQCGEIDIMELRGQQPSIINGTIHGPGYSGGSSITKAYGLQNARFDTDYHVFGVEWGKDYLEFYVDGYLYQKLTPSDVAGKGNWVYDHPFFLILNVAVGGNYVGYPTSLTPFPQKMYVDWVRVYKQAN